VSQNKPYGLRVAPHVEPTHTQYDEVYNRLLPRYGTWRGKDMADPQPDVSTGELAARYAEAARALARLGQANAEAQTNHLRELNQALADGDQPRTKQIVDAMWLSLRDVLQQTSTVEEAWNGLAPRAMPAT